MTLKPKFGTKVGKALWTFIFIFTCALPLSAGNNFQSQDQYLDGTHCQPGTISIPGIYKSAALSGNFEVTHAVMDFGGDHSLDVTTSVEQNTTGYSRYSVQLRLDSGAAQDFVVAAPPGGLRVELHDMTGDDVANDLLLRPAFLDRLPTVLLNDGHDHFTVAISASDPGSISSGQELAPRENDGHGTIGLMSSGFRMGGLTPGNQFFRQLKEFTFFRVSQVCVGDSEHTSSSGRAPPIPAI
jgi:hypothetical protein